MSSGPGNVEHFPDITSPAKTVTISYDDATSEEQSTEQIDPDIPNIIIDGSRLGTRKAGVIFVATIPCRPAMSYAQRAGDAR